MGTMTIRTLGPAILYLLSAAACSFAAVDKTLLALVPQHSQFVVGIDVVSSRSSDLGQFLSTRFDSQFKGLEQLTAETGFDPRRDLHSILFAGVSPAAGKRGVNGLVLARGTFDYNRIRSAALAKGAVVQTFSGIDLYLQAPGRGKNAFALLDTDVFATGSLTELQQAVANRSTPTRLDPQLQQLITKAGTDNDIWFASTAPASRFAMQFQPEVDQSAADGSQTLQSISAASGGVRFGSTVEITIDAIARSEKDASALADILRFGSSLLQAKGQSDPHTALLASALNQMLVSTAGQNVHLSLAMPEGTLEQLAETQPRTHMMH
jgi:hypothetical protein